MNTCDTCQWWGGSVLPVKRYGDNKICTKIVRGKFVPYNTSVSPIHDNNYISDLFTGPKFGCIHHEPK